MKTYFSLTARKQAFVDAYIENDECGSRTMRALGWTGPRPDQKAWRLLQDEQVQAALTERKAYVARQRAGSLIRAIEATANRANADRLSIFDAEGKLLPVSQWPAAIRDAVEGLEFEKGVLVRVRTSSRNEAGKQLLQYFGVTEKHEHTGKDGAPLPQAATSVYIISKDEQKQIGAELDNRV